MSKSPPRSFFAIRIIVFGAVIVVSCVIAFLFSRNLAFYLREAPSATVESPREINNDGLAVAAADLDLGEVWEAKELVGPVFIRNTTYSEQKIQDVMASCVCTTVEPRSLTIPAGETAKITLKLDLTHRVTWDMGQSRRPFSVEFRPVRETVPFPTAGWQIHGVANSRVTLDTTGIHFGETPVQGQAPPIRRVIAAVHVPRQRIEAVADPPTVDVAIAAMPKEPDRFELRISPQNDLPTGPFKTTLLVQVVDPRGCRLPAAWLPIEGIMQPEVRALPARLMLGEHPLGTTVASTVVLQVPDGVEWGIDHIDTDDPDLFVKSVKGRGIPAGRSFQVTQRITHERDHIATVRFFIRKPKRALAPTTMFVSYYGQPAENVSHSGRKRE